MTTSTPTHPHRRIVPLKVQGGPTEGPRLLTLARVAQRLGVSTVTVRRRAKEGVLTTVKVKGRLYCEEAAVRSFIERHTVSAWVPPGYEREMAPK